MVHNTEEHAAFEKSRNSGALVVILCIAGTILGGLFVLNGGSTTAPLAENGLNQGAQAKPASSLAQSSAVVKGAAFPEPDPRTVVRTSVRALGRSAAIAPVILDPFEILSSAHTPDPALLAWLVNWRNDYSAGIIPDYTDPLKFQRMPFFPSELVSLQGVLEKSPLDAFEMINLAHAFHDSSHNIPASAVMYDAASYRIESELDKPGVTGEQARPLLAEMAFHMDDYKHVLWPMIEDFHQEERFTRTLFRIYSNLVALGSQTNDADIIKAARRPVVGAAECLYITGELDKGDVCVGELGPRAGDGRGQK
jgi:hypothetical protein